MPQIIGAAGQERCRLRAGEGCGPGLVEDREVGAVGEDPGAGLLGPGHMNIGSIADFHHGLRNPRGQEDWGEPGAGGATKAGRGVPAEAGYSLNDTYLSITRTSTLRLGNPYRK